MSRILRSTLAGALVLCAAALGACSDSPTSGLRENPADAVTEAANRNVGGSARVFQVGSNEQKSKTVDPRALRPGAGQQSRYCLDPYIERDVSVDYFDPCGYDPCQYSPDPYCCTYPSDPYCNPTPVTVPPQPTVLASISYGSDASAISNIVVGNTPLKTLTLSSFSQAIQNVASTSLDASFRNVGAETGCHLTAGQFDSSHSSGSGSPLYLSSSRSPAWQGVIKWEVVGTHGFTPVSGASGGGTFYTSDFTCG